MISLFEGGGHGGRKDTYLHRPATVGSTCAWRCRLVRDWAQLCRETHTGDHRRTSLGTRFDGPASCAAESATAARSRVLYNRDRRKQGDIQNEKKNEKHKMKREILRGYSLVRIPNGSHISNRTKLKPSEVLTSTELIPFRIRLDVGWMCIVCEEVREVDCARARKGQNDEYRWFTSELSDRTRCEFDYASCFGVFMLC